MNHIRKITGFFLIALLFWWGRAQIPALSSSANGSASSARPSRAQDEPARAPSSRQPASTAPDLNALDLSQTATSIKPVVKHSDRSSEKENLKDMAETLHQFTRPESRLRDLVEYLRQSRQQPLVVRKSNPATGELAIVRTESPLPGTRYFHAQYMAGEGEPGFVQHMSFEYKPGPQAMSDARAAIQNAFPSLGAPSQQKEDFVRWELDENYFVWIKKMGPEDLKDDPFNAYTSADVGTVRVAIEVEIHERDSHSTDPHHDL